MGRGELHWRGHPTDRASAPRESEGSRAKYCITEQQKKESKTVEKTRIAHYQTSVHSVILGRFFTSLLPLRVRNI